MITRRSALVDNGLPFGKRTRRLTVDKRKESALTW